MKRINRERLESLGTVGWIRHSGSVSGGLGIPRPNVKTLQTLGMRQNSLCKPECALNLVVLFVNTEGVSSVCNG